MLLDQIKLTFFNMIIEKRLLKKQLEATLDVYNEVIFNDDKQTINEILFEVDRLNQTIETIELQLSLARKELNKDVLRVWRKEFKQNIGGIA